MKIIAADIGGTHGRLILVDVDPDNNQAILFQKDYDSRSYSNLIDLIQRFLSDSAYSGVIDRMCLAIPGPIDEQIAQLTNLDWLVDAAQLQQALAIQKVLLVNDFAAAAAGIESLHEDDYRILNKGIAVEQGHRVVTGAGTGLGMAWMYFCGGQYIHNATEGGHLDFAPTSVVQAELLLFLLDRFAHVSYERLLSGEGLLAIYQFCCAGKRLPDAAHVSEKAQQGEAEAIQAVTIFLEIYGAYVGNLALLYQPLNGIYLAGGIADKLFQYMSTDSFMDSLLNKGRMQHLVDKVPVYLVTNQYLGLYGAVNLGLR